eukprot:5365223-Amphidinium_carterae.1
MIDVVVRMECRHCPFYLHVIGLVSDCQSLKLMISSVVGRNGRLHDAVADVSSLLRRFRDGRPASCILHSLARMASSQQNHHTTPPPPSGTGGYSNENLDL